MEKICPICDKKYLSNKKDNVACSVKCGAKVRAKRSVIGCVCDYCGKDYIVNKHDAKKYADKFCSKSCSKSYYWSLNNGHHKTIDNIEHKYCAKCNQWLILSKFGRDNSTWDNRIPSCKECKKIYTKEYHKTIQSQIQRRAAKKRRNVLKKEAGCLTIKMIKFVYNKNIHDYGELSCVYCLNNVEQDWHLDHIIPLSKGGLNTLNNLTIACPQCNRRKAAKSEEEFRLLLEMESQVKQ